MNSRTGQKIGLLDILLSVYAWGAIILLTVFWNLSGIIFIYPFTVIFRRRMRNAMHGVAVLWAKSILTVYPAWSLKIRGISNIKKRKTYMLVANHQSLLDIMVALKGIPVPFRFLAKKELFSIPFLGWHMKAAGYIPLDRGNVQSGKIALDSAARFLHEGISMLFFPEGTRSEDGEMKSFKPGAFKLALEESIPVLPVVIDGTAQAIPKKSRIFERSSQFYLSIEKPVNLMTGCPLQDQINEIHRTMEERLKELRTEFREGA